MKNIIDLHTHSIASGHAYSTFMENISIAKAKGLQVYGLSDHAGSLPGGAHIFHFQNLMTIPDEIDGIRILKGVEANIIDYRGTIDMSAENLGVTDYVIASLHPPCIEGGTMAENTNAIIGAIENPFVNIIGHPDDDRFNMDYEKIVKAAKAHNVLLEVNHGSLNPRGFRQNAKSNYIKMLKMCVRYDVSVIMGSDAHIAYNVGKWDYAKDLFEEINFPEELIVNDDVEKLKKFINF